MTQKPFVFDSVYVVVVGLCIDPITYKTIRHPSQFQETLSVNHNKCQTVISISLHAEGWGGGGGDFSIQWDKIHCFTIVKVIINIGRICLSWGPRTNSVKFRKKHEMDNLISLKENTLLIKPISLFQKRLILPHSQKHQLLHIFCICLSLLGPYVSIEMARCMPYSCKVAEGRFFRT